ncbi:MAG: DUF362 domain-containing protein [Candidatus Aminicenantes bacterium]|nr:DUF362 domain-containing protein [Candidatus Aminicenantes bacterium]
MPQTKVALVRCPDYQPENLRHGLTEIFSYLGGLASLVRPGSHVFLKINHLSPPSPPERAIVTHPEFTRAVIALLKEHGCRIVVGDDIQSGAKDGFLLSGYRQMCREMGVELVNLKEKGFQKISLQGKRLTETLISPLVLESDQIINLAKLKTHSLTTFTGAIKNFYGLIPYGLRLDYHREFRWVNEFCEMLVDIYAAVKDKLCLTLMDAVVAMEGEGPSSGHPRPLGYLLGSQDAVAVDAVAAALIGLSPESVLTTSEAQARGLGQGELDKITLCGLNLQEAMVPDFKHSAAAHLAGRKIPNAIYIFIQSQFHLTPRVIKDQCSGCKECIRICPQQTIKLIQGKAWVDTANCIHCLCCHEVCRYQAIKLKQKPIGWLFRRVVSLLKKVKRKKKKKVALN